MHDIRYLKKKAYQLRIDTIQALYESEARHGHPGGCMSIAEILSVMYYHTLRIDPKDPAWIDRDRFLLSKGHNCLILYAVLADLGYIGKEVLPTYKSVGSILQGHPDCRKCAGIDFTSGSLGQGLSIGVGMALDAKRAGRSHHVYVVISDGELQEGMLWEAAMSASHYKLSNLTCLVDRNNLQVNGLTETIMDVEPLEDRFRAFGWHTMRIDGHDVEAIVSAVYLANACHDVPTAIICDTIKGKGVSFMENVMEWHANTLTDELYKTAMEDLHKIYDSMP
jgi:Transketolase, N-terminal subunit